MYVLDYKGKPYGQTYGTKNEAKAALCSLGNALLYLRVRKVARKVR